MHSLFMRLFILVAIAIAASTTMKSHAGLGHGRNHTAPNTSRASPFSGITYTTGAPLPSQRCTTSS
jgi:hypothetical protein